MVFKTNLFYKKLGDKIHSERKKRKLSQEQLALISGIDRTYLARIEEGKANPSIKVLCKISRTLKVKLFNLLEGI
jgi:transcriptional regulator with XRE-family HTH domain